MKNYEIEVDGQVYQVKVRELPDDTDMKMEPKPINKSETGGEEINAPMSGTILRVLVKPGQAVEVGDNLFILEAMKMENEIQAPRSGVIKEILVKPNESVESDQELAIM